MYCIIIIIIIIIIIFIIIIIIIIVGLQGGCSTNLLSIPGSDKRLFYAAEGPDLLWGPPSLPFSEFLGLKFILLRFP